MAKQVIDLGTGAGQNDGDNLFEAFTKVKANFDDLYGNKEAGILAGQTTQYFRGDKTFQNLNIQAVTGLQDSLDDKASTGDVTGSGLTLPSNRLLGRISTSTGAVEVLDASQTRTFLSINNVNNTSDADKPVSTLTQTALDGKEAKILAGGAGQYYRGDKTFQDLNKAAVGLSQVDNTSDANKPVFTATANGQVTAPGSTAFSSGNRFLASDGTWKVVSSGSTQVFTASQDGLVPASGGGQTKYLRADGSWSVPQQNLSISFIVQGNQVGSTSSRVVSDPYAVQISNSVARTLQAPAAQTVFQIFRNEQAIGTVTFDAGATTGAISIPVAADRSLLAGDILDLTIQGTPDSQMTRVSLVLHN